MKNSIRITLIAFLGGLAGALVIQLFVAKPQVTEVIREVPQVREIDYDGVGENINPAEAPSNFREAAERSVHSVVYIKNLQKTRRNVSFADWLYGRETSTREIAIGTGSGVIYSEDGYIITNHHVIEDADDIEVQHEKQTYRAELVGTDPSMDIAVLKIDADNLPAINVGKSNNVSVGDWVLAVGNPFNLTSTVTAGIVSAIGSEANIVRENFPIELYIQTDAAINPGNSGGALVNTNGDLVGINTSIISKTGSYAGYGFAVPSDVVVKIVEDLKKYKKVQNAYTGAEFADITSKLADTEGLNSLRGVFIQSVRRDGAADKAGLNRGDVIRKVNGQSIESKSRLDEIIRSLSPGDKLSVDYQRGSRTYNTDIVMENALGNTDILGSDALSANDVYFSDYLGAEMRKLTPSELEQNDLRAGVKITEIDQERGFLRRLEFNEGDIIVAINRRLAGDPKAVANYLQRYYGSIYIDVIDSRGKSKTLTYTFR